MFVFLDLLLDILWALAVNGAADGDAGSEDLENGSLEGSGHGGRSNFLGNSNDLIERELSVVDNVLGLLSVTWGLLQGLEDERGSGGLDGDGSLTVLNHNLNVDLDTSPVLGGFLNIFTDFLW